ncbi:HNH endonuclease signature motif containing protein [Microbacterium lacusdiani]
MAEQPIFEALSPHEAMRAAIAVLRSVQPQIAGMSDAETVSFAPLAEELGRLTDGIRVRTAGEIDARSDRMLDERLSAQHGCRNGIELLERLTQAPTREVVARVRLDKRLRAETALTGEALPPRHPEVAAAMRHGDIGTPVAELITGTLDRVAHRADPVVMIAAERELVASATGLIAGMPPTFAQLKVQADTWAAYLDQDGPAPDAEKASQRRGFTIGKERDGLFPARGDLTPEGAAVLQRILDAGGNPAVRFTDSYRDKGEGEPWTDDEPVDDPRTPAQKRHDVLVAALHAAARSLEVPTLGGDAPTLLVHVALEDLQSPTGVATIDGIDVPVPADLAHRIACTGAVQKVVFDRNGRIVRLGTKERLFNHHQRKAITARDGGCIIPGCTIPAAWCEIHHVQDHAKGGPTHTDNGVLLGPRGEGPHASRMRRVG